MAKERVQRDTELVNKSKETKNGYFREKEFKPRDSLLTDLFEIGHFKSIRHLCIAIFIFLCMNNIFQCYYGSDSINSAFLTIKLSFNQFDRVIPVWILMFASTVAVYPLFSLWANFRFHFSPKSVAFKFWDNTWMGGFIIYYILFLIVPPYLKGIQIHLSSAAVVLCEQIRLLMKTHAFVRSNAPRVLNHHTHSDKPMPIPAFSKYLYFLFAPTLVYRDSYPRTKTIRWFFVLTHFVDCLFCVIFLSVIVSHSALPLFRNYPSGLTTWQSIVIAMFNVIPLSMFVLLSIYYIMFHCWLNAWAEMMTFADRQFYGDWWNTTSLIMYFRKWSGTIHDFLHEYIYRDFYETIVPGNKIISILSVFILSGIVHDYVLSFILGFFYPVSLVQLCTLGMPFMFIKVDEKQYFGNVFIWWVLIFGIASQITLSSIEYYARINSPKENTDWTDFFTPRSWSCSIQNVTL